MSSTQLDILEHTLFLKRSSLFATMNTRELKALASICKTHRFSAGETVVSQGDVGESMFLIKEGVVQIKHSSGNREVELAQLTTGETFGEMAMFDSEMRSATVSALSESTFLSIHRDDLTDLIRTYPDIALELIQMLVQRLRGNMERLKEAHIAE